MSKFQTVKKAYGVNKELAQKGVWYRLKDTDVEFLMRPANTHNLEFAKKTFELDFENKYGEKWQFEILFNEELRRDFGKLYFGTVILDYRYTDGRARDEMTEEDVVELFVDTPMAMKELSEFAVNNKNYQLVDEASVKN